MDNKSFLKAFRQSAWILFIVICAMMGFTVIFSPFNVDEFPVRAKQARTKADMRSVAIALESFHDAHGRYPGVVPFDIQWLGERSAPGASRWTPSSIDPGAGNERPGLMTPIAFMDAPAVDPFAKQKWKRNRVPLAYFNDEKGGWILISRGPDGDYDIDPAIEYDSTQQVPSESLIQHQYDPSNGTVSDGDIFRCKD